MSANGKSFSWGDGFLPISIQLAIVVFNHSQKIVKLLLVHPEILVELIGMKRQFLNQVVKFTIIGSSLQNLLYRYTPVFPLSFLFYVQVQSNELLLRVWPVLIHDCKWQDFLAHCWKKTNRFESRWRFSAFYSNEKCDKFDPGASAAFPLREFAFCMYGPLHVIIAICLAFPPSHTSVRNNHLFTYMGLFQNLLRFQAEKTAIPNINNSKILSVKVIKHPFIYVVLKFPTLMTTANVSLYCE